MSCSFCDSGDLIAYVMKYNILKTPITCPVCGDERGNPHPLNPDGTMKQLSSCGAKGLLLVYGGERK